MKGVKIEGTTWSKYDQEGSLLAGTLRYWTPKALGRLESKI